MNAKLTLTVEQSLLILTRNIKDYRKSEWGVFTPATFLKTIVQIQS